MIRAIGTRAAIGAALALGVSASAVGQEERRPSPVEATIYRDMAYNGPAVAINADQPNLGLAWPVNSIRVRAGRWELCERTRYRGRCTIVDRDTPMLGGVIRGIPVQSIRPVGGGGGGGGGDWGDAPANNQTVQGTFAQFHTQPQRNGRRIRACANNSGVASCAARTADEFCRANGWNGSAREHQETVNRVIYLADVLCVRSGY